MYRCRINGEDIRLIGEPTERLRDVLYRTGYLSVRDSDDAEGFAGSDTIIFNGQLKYSNFILLYQADLVPIGADQKQHLELTRDIAQRFNGVYGDVFTIPEPYIAKVGSKIMSLQEPTRKMSKSDPEDTYIALLDDADTIRRKVKRAVTDSEACVRYAEGKDGVNNLMEIYSAVTGKTYEEIENEFIGCGYGKFKPVVGEAVVEHLRPIREESLRLMKDKAYLEGIYQEGAQRAQYLANKTLRKVYKKVGLVLRKRG